MFSVYGPHSLSIPGFSGYSDNPRIFLGPPMHGHPLSEYPSIPGVLGKSQEVPGITCVGTPTALVSQDSWDAQMIPDVFGTTSPLSEHHRIPGIPRKSKNAVGTKQGGPLSEYPRIPRIFGRSQDVPGITCAGTPSPYCLSIPRLLGYLDDPRMLWDYNVLVQGPLVSEYPRIPGIILG